jgi:hypothetical protein
MQNKRSLVNATLCLLATSCGGIEVEHVPSSSEEGIINGWKADNWQYPTTVGLFNKMSNDVQCTGTLVRPDAVLTAAHCVSGLVAPIYAVTYNGNKGSPPILLRAYSSDSHPDGGPNYEGCNLLDGGKCVISDERPWDDVALIVLKEVAPDSACAPILPQNRFEEFLGTGTYVRIAGFGVNRIEEPGALYAADVPIMLRTTSEVEVGEDKPDASGACFGDSGGPIYVVADGRVMVTGITSRSAWKPECGHGGVYELPGKYIEWFELTYAKRVCQRNWEIDHDDAAKQLCLAGGASLTDETNCRYTSSLPPAEPPTVKPPNDSGTIKPVNDAGLPPPKPGQDASIDDQPAGDDAGCGCTMQRTGTGWQLLACVGALAAFFMRRQSQ